MPALHRTRASPHEEAISATTTSALRNLVATLQSENKGLKDRNARLVEELRGRTPARTRMNRTLAASKHNKSRSIYNVMAPIKQHGVKWFARNYTADSCPCSLDGCQSLWPCLPSRLCFEHDPVDAPATMHDDELQARISSGSSNSVKNDTTFLFFLAFNSSLVRNLFAKDPKRARDREVNRVLWFARTAKAVHTRLPIHAVVAGEPLDAPNALKLQRAGVRLLYGPMVPTPVWASKWHRLSFNKITALWFTRFRRVVVLDNDAGLLLNMDHLASAPTPSAVFHTTIGPLAKRTPCAVTTGLLVLEPSAERYARALELLSSMNYTRERYDGGDEEFWLQYFVAERERGETLMELPWRYHAHRLLPMNGKEWEKVRMMHLISNLAGRGWHIPRNVTARVEKYCTPTSCPGPG